MQMSCAGMVSEIHRSCSKEFYIGEGGENVSSNAYIHVACFCLGTEVPRLSAESILSGDTAHTSAGK